VVAIVPRLRRLPATLQVVVVVVVAAEVDMQAVEAGAGTTNAESALRL
jgi:hypothetical protein